MRKQNELLRRNALGSFRTILTEITRDPAMLLWLSGSENTKWSPNENYAREMMELFTLGADRGYSERDVREQARALTGFRNDWDDGIGPHAFRYDREFHDTGRKRVFGRAGTYDWRDSVRLCLTHKKHPSFVVGKLWSYFIPGKPDARDRARARAALRQPALRDPPARRGDPPAPALLRGPADGQAARRLHRGPAARDRQGDRRGATGPGSPTWRARCCSTRRTSRAGTSRAGSTPRPSAAAGSPRTTRSARGHSIPRRTAYDSAETPEAAVAKALEFWGNPALTPTTRDALQRFASQADALADQPWKRPSYPIMRQNALRMLVATSPDMQTC